MRHLAQARNPPSVVMDSGLIVSGMTVEEKICFGINLICPVQSRLQKYFRFRLTQITSYPSPSRPTEGRFAIVTDVGHGMRWTRQRWARDGIAGRVLARERSPGAQTNNAFADGEVVWS